MPRAPIQFDSAADLPGRVTGGRPCHSATMSQKRATAIHLFEKDGRIHAVNFSAGEWESPYWAVGDAVAEDLKADGDIYFHKAQTAPSYFGGRVFDFRKQPDGEGAGRIAFLFRFDEDHRGVMSGRGGWSQAMKIIWQADESIAAARPKSRSAHRPKPLARRS